jgi:hypothetical protein
MEWQEAKPAPMTPGPIYEFRRGYRVKEAKIHENPAQFAAFQEYLRLPAPKSISDLSRMTGHMVQTLANWRRKFNWEKRAAAWHKDQVAITYREADRMKREAHRQAIIDFRESSERQARIMSRVSEDLVRVLGKRIAQAEEQGEEIPMHLVGGLLRAAAGINEQSRQAWGHALGVNELLEVVDTEVEKVRIEELNESSDPYEFEIDD